jgi:FG-GAP-like repeat
MDIVTIQWKIGTIVYKTDTNTSIIQGNIDNDTPPDNTIILDRISTYSSEKFSLSHLADTVTGYRYIYKDNNTVLDESKNGPEWVDSIGITPEMSWVGWKWTNRMMLSYAWGDTVWEASRWFQSYTLINLGDPVTHNDKKAVGTQLDGIDRSIGTQLTSSQASPVQSFAQRDMDKDWYEDIVVQHADGYIELLLNLTNKIRSRGNIAYVPDLTSRWLSLGDFQWDGYADILGVDKKWDLVLLINDERRFTRQKLQVNPGQIVPTGITQFRIRDMDADKKDDIVYITEWWELSILYWTNTSGIFDKKLLDATLGISLSPTPIKTGGAVFARHIPQISLESTSTTEWPDESYIWNEVYVQHAYNEAKTPVIADVSDATGYAIFDDEFSSIASSAATSTSIRTKNFARSEYAGAFGIDISKKFTVATGSTLQSWSRVIVNIDIKNTTNSPIQGLEYLDTIPKIFGTDNTLKYTIKNGNNTLTRDFSLTSASNYDAYFNLIDIAGW